MAWLGGALRSLAALALAAAGHKALQLNQRGEPDRRQGQAATFGHQASQRRQRGCDLRRSVVVVVCGHDEVVLARGAVVGCRGANDQVRTLPPFPPPLRFGPRAGQCVWCVGWIWGVCGGRAGVARAQGGGMGAADPYFVANSTRFLLLSLLHKPEVVGCDGGDRPTESERKQYRDVSPT